MANQDKTDPTFPENCFCLAQLDREEFLDKLYSVFFFVFVFLSPKYLDISEK